MPRNYGPGLYCHKMPFSLLRKGPGTEGETFEHVDNFGTGKTQQDFFLLISFHNIRRHRGLV